MHNLYSHYFVIVTINTFKFLNVIIMTKLSVIWKNWFYKFRDFLSSNIGFHPFTLEFASLKRYVLSNAPTCTDLFILFHKLTIPHIKFNHLSHKEHRTINRQMFLPQDKMAGAAWCDQVTTRNGASRREVPEAAPRTSDPHESKDRKVRAQHSTPRSLVDAPLIIQLLSKKKEKHKKKRALRRRYDRRLRNSGAMRKTFSEMFSFIVLVYIIDRVTTHCRWREKLFFCFRKIIVLFRARNYVFLPFDSFKMHRMALLTFKENFNV